MEVSGKRTEFDEGENAESNDFSCEPCQSNSTTTSASGFCKDCEEFMCNKCFRQHLNLRICKHHVLVNSNQSSLSFQRSGERKICCKQHNGETVKFYCRTHEFVGCGDCIIFQHKTCQSEYIQDLSDNFQQNKEYKSLKENIEKVIFERKCFEKEIEDNKKDNKVMLEKALSDIKQFRLDINEYLDKVESDVIAKVKTIMKENKTLLIKLENECKTLSDKLEEITAMLNSELFNDNALFIHTVEFKPKVSDSAVTLSDMKSKTMKKYEFVPDQELRSFATTDKSLGTVAISTVNVCHQTTETANDEEIKKNPRRRKRVKANDDCGPTSIEPEHAVSLAVKEEPEKHGQSCMICMDEVTVPKTLKCGHSFCTDCLDKYFEIKRTCPTCGAICGVITGDQPEGRMDVFTNRYCHCEGYPDVGQIVITYTFKSGTQGTNHPSPGSTYDGITRRAYLPDNEEGQKICKMLKVAFERNLVFTIGRSRTNGKEGVITWNDIHHKTDPRSYTQFGYPDKTYLSRVKDELAAKGVTEDDIE